MGPDAALFFSNRERALAEELQKHLQARKVLWGYSGVDWDEEAQRGLDQARCVVVACGKTGLTDAQRHAAHYALQQQNAGFLAVVALVLFPDAGDKPAGSLEQRAELIDLRKGWNETELDRLATLARAGKPGRHAASNNLKEPALLEGSSYFKSPELPWHWLLLAVCLLVAAYFILTG